MRPVKRTPNVLSVIKSTPLIYALSWSLKQKIYIKCDSLQLHMVQMGEVLPQNLLGLLGDDGAPYSGMGIVELESLLQKILPAWNGDLDPLPKSIADRPYWQYGNGNHASQRRKILGSFVLTILSDNGNPVQISHLIIEGSSSWVIGRNVKLCRYGNFYGFKVLRSILLTRFNCLTMTYIAILLCDQFYHSSNVSVYDPVISHNCAFSGELTWE